MKYRIKNWGDFQHYKDRMPPWIKLHNSLLTSEVWVMGDDASRALIVACMLLASRNEANDGTFNGDPEYVKRFAYLHSKPDFKPLIQYGFIESVQDASEVLAECITEERREEENREEKKRKKPSIKTASDFQISDSVRKWASDKGYGQLEKRLDHFVGYCLANGKTYKNWDQAFMNAVRDNWAKIKEEPKTQPSELCPQWCADAGFANHWEANNKGCWQHNAHLFKNGVQIERA